MKVLVVFALCALVASTYGATLDVYEGPVQFEGEAVKIKESLDDKAPAYPEEDVNGGSTRIRARRFTCDLLSFSSKIFTPNHAGCAAHCVATRHQGGSCKNGICYCRGKW